ncbi:MAG TPA: glycosyltransferase family 1 protein [Candidatus Moranbacteria bacterium]|nr:glycosyltransferase family 1 protein [Candidatus Moranbacteria bacterium]
MVRIGIIISTSEGWMGGINYMKNLLRAASSIGGKKIEFVLFFGEKSDRDVVASFEGFGEIIRTPILDNSNAQGVFNILSWRFFGGSFMMNQEFEKAKIDIVSHSRIFLKNRKYKIINWIPDFQHFHMPKMFSYAENMYRNYLFKAYVKNSNAVILSSNDALNDYKKLYPKYIDKAHVLQFVSQPNEKIYGIKGTKQIEEKYKFSGKFFYLPNQFWKHKNHMIVLKALSLLKKEGKDILVLCTGHAGDYRNKNHFENILRYVKENNIENNVKFLGLIDYLDVMTLMRHCISIINPSLFEGWSSTVEEAKSVGKNMILSNLNVHKEQNPPNSIYFDPHNEKELADKLWKKWQESEGGPDFDLEEIARKNIETRTKNFGNTYQNIVLNVLKK